MAHNLKLDWDLCDISQWDRENSGITLSDNICNLGLVLSALIDHLDHSSMQVSFVLSEGSAVVLHFTEATQVFFFISLSSGRSSPAHQLIQNAATQLVFNLLKTSNITPCLSCLHWLPVAAWCLSTKPSKGTYQTLLCTTFPFKQSSTAQIDPIPQETCIKTLSCTSTRLVELPSPDCLKSQVNAYLKMKTEVAPPHETMRTKITQLVQIFWLY